MAYVRHLDIAVFLVNLVQKVWKWFKPLKETCKMVLTNVKVIWNAFQVVNGALNATNGAGLSDFV